MNNKLSCSERVLYGNDNNCLYLIESEFIMKQKINIHWFRRDLRLEDNPALYQALNSNLPVLAVFIFDKEILERLEEKEDLRVCFIHEQINLIKKSLELKGSSLKVFYSKPTEAFKELSELYDIHTVFFNRDYEPSALKRDEKIILLLSQEGVGVQTEKDHVIFEMGEVQKNDGSAYTVFTPYSKKWKLRLQQESIPNFPSELQTKNFFQSPPFHMPGLKAMGFKSCRQGSPNANYSEDLMREYAGTRNLPYLNATSRLGIYLRFGTISVREVVKLAQMYSEEFLNQLIWRDFFIQILGHYPYAEHKAFKTKYDHIEWRNNEVEYNLWREGKTGYPIVDAGMRELRTTGYMHNRVRMIAASFLVKHLLIDWRWGEAWFAQKLLDYELASNNGNWQWAAGTGCDAAPYFRIFNPITQQKKFDPEFRYIKKWIHEFGTPEYPDPMVDHAYARERCLSVYRSALHTES